MATTEYYYYGKGKIWARPYGVVNAKWRWYGDVSEATMKASVEKVQHLESYSGSSGLVRDFPLSKALSVDLKLHQLDTDGLADLVYGTVTTVASGAVANEPLPTVAAGDTVKLEFAGVSSLVITDSAGSPVTIAGSNYVLDDRFGSIDFTSLPSSPAPTQPLKASYTRASQKQLALLTKAQPIIQFRYEGLNLAENNAPTIWEIYKMSTGVLSELALISSGTDVSGVPVSLAALLDSSKPATGALGQFGRMVTVG